MRGHASRRGVELTSRSRPLTPRDLREFDLIVGMDAQNIAAIQRAADHWAAKQDVPQDYRDKVCLMTQYLESDKFKSYNEVPDPYYGGAKGFELVLDMLEDACTGLLKDLQAKA